jgi:hypothetical protein
VADVPREQNAAYLYLEAINTYDELPKDLEAAFTYAQGKAWPEGEAGQQLAGWLGSANNRQAMALAMQASRMPACQFPYFGTPNTSIINVLLPSLSEHRRVCKMLAARARQLASEKKFEEAYEHYAAIFHMGQHVQDGITLIEALVGIACRSLAEKGITDLALQPGVPEPVLQRILNVHLAPQRESPLMERSMRMEKQFSLAIIDEFVRSQNFLRPQFWAAISGTGEINGDFALPGPTGWSALEADLSRLLFPDRAVKKHMSDYYDEMIRRASLPPHLVEDKEDWGEQYVKSLPQWDILTRFLLPAVNRAIQLGERVETQHRMTRLAVALRAYAARHGGQSPDQLEPLVGALGSPDDLIDPFSGAQFVYLPNGKSWKFYTLSTNEVDDGGDPGQRDWDLDYVIQFPPEPPEPFTPSENEDES